MSHFEIIGGVPLHGEVRLSGSKNAALPIMGATILASEPVRLRNMPWLTDVRTQSAVLRRLGVEMAQVDDEMTLETVDPRPVCVPERLARQMRASFCVLGPLLARRGRAVVPLPGGCNIGHRPVDLHLKGLAALGAELRLERGYVVATARRLTGATIELGGPRGPTVTGTANILSAAVLAQGTTIIHGAAIEPEIVDLGNFLVAIGARISGLGTPTVHIEGVDQLGGATYRLISDRIEAATLLMAVAITGGSATIAGVVPEHLGNVLALLRAAGAEIDVSEGGRGQVHVFGLESARKEHFLAEKWTSPRGTDRVSITATRPLRAVDAVAQPYPGIPTDIQAQWTALMSVAVGTSHVQDRVFPGRFLHVAELNRLGAKITCNGDTATIEGITCLSGARVTARDLRASAALVLAGLAAEGRTTVDHVHHLDRGYQRFDAKLQQLGASIIRVTDQPSNSLTPRPVAVSFSVASRLASGHPMRRASSR